eukprot:TRINITY_DN848_c0_g4_i1.p1 TRINITY_DN848_c0_g4~~TRINITY_DN848_c0_g4_i1.p1  ORF type:complete len:669 (-),score=227.56 TRINITY_DN848_c0_g4_i1:41-2047(-)
MFGSDIFRRAREIFGSTTELTASPRGETSPVGWVQIIVKEVKLPLNLDLGYGDILIAITTNKREARTSPQAFNNLKGWYEVLNFIVEDGCYEINFVLRQKKTLLVRDICSYRMSVNEISFQSYKCNDFCISLQPTNIQLLFNIQWKHLNQQQVYFENLKGQDTQLVDFYGFEYPKMDRNVLFQENRRIENSHKYQTQYFETHEWWKNLKSKDKLKDFARVGLPVEIRGEIWARVIGAKEQRDSYPEAYLFYSENQLLTESGTFTQIQKDIARTCPNHPIYSTKIGRGAIQRLLLAISNSNPTLGYCQAMNFVASYLLLFLDEELAFHTMQNFIQKIIPGYYNFQMIGLKVDTLIIQKLLLDLLPRIHNHFKKIDFDISMLLPSWLLPCFIGIFPAETTFRILDILLIEGCIGLFLPIFGLLQIFTNEILSFESFEECFLFLNEKAKYFFNVDTLLTTGAQLLRSFKNSDFETMRKQNHISFVEEQKTKDFFELARTTFLNEEHLNTIWNKFLENRISSSVCIDFATFEKLLIDINITDKEMIQIFFKSFDSNGDGTIDFREFICGLHILAAGAVDCKLQFLFNCFDLDGSGFLDKEEIWQMLQLQYRMVAETTKLAAPNQRFVDFLFKEADIDANGKIDFKEFEIVFSRLPLLSEWMLAVSYKILDKF